MTTDLLAEFNLIADGVEARVSRFPDIVGHGATVDEAYEDLAAQVDPLIIASA